MDSKENLEQPGTDSGAGNEQPSNPDKIKLADGSEVTIDELKSGYMRQSDYTKKTQTLAEQKKSADNPELDQTKKILKDMGFATVDEIADLKKFKEESMTEKQKQTAEKEFNDFASQFTLDESQKNILKDLKKVHTDKSYDDILKSTGFIEQSKLEKAKTSGGVVGGEKLGIPIKKEEPSINPKVAKKFGLKSKGELEDIKSKFNL